MRWPRLPWVRRRAPDLRLRETVRETWCGESTCTEGSLAAGATDRGLVRSNNEDAVLCAPERGLYIVADGMGGQVAGEEASALVVAVVAEALSPERIEEAAGTGVDTKALLEEAFRQAQEAVSGLSAAHPEWGGRAGSTAVVAVLRGDALHVANSGDSRAYLVRAGNPQVLTRDHSLAALLVQQGQLSEGDARGHRLRNQLTAYVGMARPVAPAYQEVLLCPGDRVVLCSDGIWDMLPDGEIARLAAAAPHARVAVRALVEAANRAGGRDNATVVVVIVPGGEEAHPSGVDSATAILPPPGS